MKKLFIFLVIVLMPMLETAAAAAKKSEVRGGGPSEIISIINQYSMKDGFEVVKVGSMGMGLVKPILRIMMDSSDPDQRMVLDLIKGIKKIAVVHYEGCDEDMRSKFVSKVERSLSDENLLMDASDGSDSVRIYGFVSEDGSTMKDFVLHSPSENALVCLFGTISMDAIVALAGN